MLRNLFLINMGVYSETPSSCFGDLCVPAEFLACSRCNQRKTLLLLPAVTLYGVCFIRSPDSPSLIHCVSSNCFFNGGSTPSRGGLPQLTERRKSLHPPLASPTEIKQPLCMKGWHVKGLQENPGGSGSLDSCTVEAMLKSR